MNKVILTGNITRDIELRYTPNGKAVCDIGIANNDTKDKTAFIECVAWDKNAEFISQYFRKGKAILIEGSLIQDEWEDRDSGKKRTKTRVNIFRAEFQGKKEGDDFQPQQQPTQFGTQQHAQAQIPVPQIQAPVNAVAPQPQQNVAPQQFAQPATSQGQFENPQPHAPQPVQQPQAQYQQPANMAPPQQPVQN